MGLPPNIALRCQKSEIRWPENPLTTRSGQGSQCTESVHWEHLSSGNEGILRKKVRRIVHVLGHLKGKNEGVLRKNMLQNVHDAPPGPLRVVENSGSGSPTQVPRALYSAIGLVVRPIARGAEQQPRDLPGSVLRTPESEWKRSGPGRERIVWEVSDIIIFLKTRIKNDELEQNVQQ